MLSGHNGIYNTYTYKDGCLYIKVSCISAETTQRHTRKLVLSKFYSPQDDIGYHGKEQTPPRLKMFNQLQHSHKEVVERRAGWGCYGSLFQCWDSVINSLWHFRSPVYSLPFITVIGNLLFTQPMWIDINNITSVSMNTKPLHMFS